MYVSIKAMPQNVIYCAPDPNVQSVPQKGYNRKATSASTKRAGPSGSLPQSTQVNSPSTSNKIYNCPAT